MGDECGGGGESVEDEYTTNTRDLERMGCVAEALNEYRHLKSTEEVCYNHFEMEGFRS